MAQVFDTEVKESMAAFAYLDESIKDEEESGDLTDEEARKARAQRRLGAIQDCAGLDGLVGTGGDLVRFGRSVADLGQELELVAG